jgi:hypothetical protein
VEIHVSCSSLHIFRVTNSSMTIRLGHEGEMGGKRNECSTLVEKSEMKIIWMALTYVGK